MDYLIDTRSKRPGYRLHRLELFNWGTFDSTDGQVFRFEPEGRTSLLVGHNGSGKSTLVDALLTLLVEPRIRNYNVAAGARKTERTEKSYIRGAFDRTSDEAQSTIVRYLRESGSNFTAIAAVFRDEELDRAFTICQLLYLTADGSSDKRFGIIDQARELKGDLQGLRRSNEVRRHLESLGYETTKSFTQYHGWLARRTNMRSRAMDMFNQTVAVKDIQSLNRFIRGHMLEAHDWREKVQRLLHHFNDLSQTHQELQRTRRAMELLRPIEQQGNGYRTQAAGLEEAERHLEAAESFFRTATIRLFEPEIERLQEELEATIAKRDRLGRRFEKATERIRKLRNELDQAGGDRLREIPQLIGIEQAILERKQDASQRFHRQLQQCGIQDVATTAGGFSTIQTALQKVAEASSEEMARLTEQQEISIGERATYRRLLRDESAELRILNERKTNLPSTLATLRSDLCRELDLPEKELPFVAELIAVDPEERRWEAAAEHVLSSFARSLLVPDRHYQLVRSYVEQHNLRQRLVYLRVGKRSKLPGDRLHPQSLVHKLRFREEHSLTRWVQAEVQRRFDYGCCESVEEFDDTTGLAMTANRHFKTGRERHEKDDRPQAVDPRHFVLGWDNREKKRLLKARMRELEARLQNLDEVIDAQNQSLGDLQRRRDAAAEARALQDFDSIDVQRHEEEIAALESERAQLTSSSDAVKALRNRLESAETEARSIQEERDGTIKQEESLQNGITAGLRAVENARRIIEHDQSTGEFTVYEENFVAIQDSIGQPLTVDSLTEVERVWNQDAQERVRDLRETIEPQKERLLDAMNRFLREFREEQSDLSPSVRALDSFLGLLDQIRRDDLPRHERQFKDRLNDKVCQEVGTFNLELRQECRHIEERIEQLNDALAQVEYRSGTLMRLEPRPVQDGEIEDFRRSLRDCLDESFDDSADADEARFQRICRLVERLSDNDRTAWRNKVIDVRNWFNFGAREVDRETGETCSFHEGSSGQSGGEKAKLAFTILVAAIAYQYDIDPGGDSSGRFHFVVVDEMFSRVDDQNAQYALRLFQQFGLQLLIVAPLDAKARVTEPFVDSYLHVVKDEKTNRSQLYGMTAVEYDEVVRDFVDDSGQRTSRRRRPR